MIATSVLHEPAADPLITGEQLSRAEFERRWDAMPDLKRAELVEGVVSMSAALRANQHGDPHFLAVGWMSHYSFQTPGVIGSDSASLRLDDANMPQPDITLRLTPELGGHSHVDEDGYLSGGPELAFEISASTIARDLGHKFHVFARHGIREYVVWRVDDARVDWFVLRHGVYVRQTPETAGCFQSEVFPGLWLNSEALVEYDMPSVLSYLRQGMATPAYAAFCHQGTNHS